MKKQVLVKVIQNEEKPIPAEILAQSILDISNAMKLIGKSRLNRNALIVLLRDKTHLYKSNITAVLDGLDSLEKDWLK